jgi:hypothetical protein
MKKIIVVFLSFLAIVFSGKLALAQTNEDLSVELSSTVQVVPPQITLHWKNITFGKPHYLIYKKSKTATSWGAAIDSLPAGATSYNDLAVIIDSAYEYQVLAPGTSFISTGYIYAGIKAPAIHNRGILLLLVDSTFTDSCSVEIASLMNDLSGDGWQIIRHDFSRTDSDTAIKSVISNDYAANPDVNAVFILGHIAVPYSGELMPDGHLDHLGAWPADVYYGSMNSLWTDNLVNDSASVSFPANINLPGDGKWDQTVFPPGTELQVSRVDVYDMPAFATSEIQLMKRYLAKDHAYKMDSIEMRHRAIIRDEFNYSIEGFAGNGWRNFAPLVSRDSITVVGYYYLVPELATSSYQWVYACGGGTFTSANGVGTTFDIAAHPNYSIFSMYFGSYFGDWNVQNNYLRAPLCANPPSLTNCWAGRPNWQFHHMALGENIGYSAKLTQNNNTGLYTMPYNYAAGGIHVALMGDLSLRTNYLKQPANLLITPNQYGAMLSWNASPDTAVIGYYVYRADSAYGHFEKITSNMLISTYYSDTLSTNGLKYYMVRPVKLQPTASGSYYNLGVGIQDTVTISTSVSQIEVLQASLNISVFPNPALHYLNVSLLSTKVCNAKLYLLNETGQYLNVITKQLQPGINNYSLNIINMSAGAYTLVIETGNRKEEIKWVKL